MNLIQLQTTRDALKQSLQSLERIKPCCHTCEHYQGNRCDKFAAVPPPEWVAGPVECEQWSYDNIPF